MWPRWFILNRKRILPNAVIALSILVILWAVSISFGPGALSGKELFDSALTNTINSSSYRYNVEVKQGSGDTITIVEGARVNPGRVHIKGTMQNSAMEFIQIDDNTYMKDPWSERWFTLKGNPLTQSELFLSEFNPLGLLNFKDIPSIKMAGTARVDGVKTDILELQPDITIPLLSQRYSSFNLKVWIDPRGKLIRRTYMQANLPGGKAGLIVETRFWGFNDKIDIKPPQVKDLEIESEKK